MEAFDGRIIISHIKKRLWLVIVMTVIFTLAGGILSYFVLSPVYEARTELLVNQVNQEDSLGMVSLGEIESNIRMIETYTVIMNSPRILDIVIERLNNQYTIEELKKKLQVKGVNNSQVFAIIVRDHSQEQAVHIANVIANAFEDEIVQLTNIDHVHLLTPAKVIDNPTPVKPKPFLYITISFLLGFIFSSGLVLILALFNNRLSTETEIEQYLALPVLGSISVIDPETDLAKLNTIQRNGEPQ